MTATPDRATKAHEPDGRKEFELANTRIVVEPSPAGATARIERPGWHEYAGPLPSKTIDALAEVSR